jgi:hypothetical protein
MKNRGMIGIMLGLLLALGWACTTRPAAAGEEPMKSPESLSPDESAPRTETTYGEECVLEGRYEVDALPGGKRFQGTWLVLDDGHRYVLSYRPDPARFEFLNKRVSIRGRPYQPGVDTQHISADHLQVITMGLAPGETPWPEPPRAIPHPSLIRRKSDLDGAPRWVSMVGRVELVEKVPDEYFARAVVILEDGTAVLVEPATKAQWDEHLGEVVTVTGPLYRLPAKAAPGEFPFSLGRPHAVCPGIQPGCGMEH